jgi:hypothetical protein
MDKSPEARQSAWVDTEPPLPHVATLPVLGIATCFATNDRAMLDVVDEAFGVWRALASADPSGHSTVAPVQVRIVVSRDGSDAAAAAPIRHTMDAAHRFVASSPGGTATSDPATRTATIRASAALVADRARFRTEMLESVVLALLSSYDRHPVHAAAVARGGHALLLAAPSGTGKSTLAYVCHAAGLDLLGDDHVRVQLDPSLRVWGWPSRVRLLTETAERMGAPYESLETTSGKRKSLVDARRGVSAARLVATDATVCLLTRDGGPLALEPLNADAVAAALDAQLVPGFDRFPARWPAVRRALAVRGGWRLNLSADPHDALPVVRDLLARSGRRG